MALTRGIAIKPDPNHALTRDERSWIEGVRISHESGWTHLRVEGPAYARGFQHGYALAGQYASCLASYRFITLESFGVDYDVFAETAARLHKNKLGEEITAEMQGIAAGLTRAGEATTLDDIIGWNAWIEISGSWWPANKGDYASHAQIDRRSCRCSAFIATGSATADGGIVLAHETFDDFWNGGALNLILEIWPDSGSAIIMQSSPGYIASMTDFFVTSAGLVGAETTIAGFHGYDPAGVPEYVRIRNAMQYGATIVDFVRRLNDGNNGGYANTWLIGDVNTGEIAEYQQGLRFQALNQTQEGYFAGANWVNDPRIRNLECAFTGYNDVRQQVGARRARWPQLIDPRLGEVDAEAAKVMLADHYNLYTHREEACATTICAHYDNDPRYYMSSQEAVESAPFVGMGSMDGKVTTSAMARDMKIWARYGRACGEPFDAESYLEAHPQWNWLDGHLPSRRSQPWATFTGTRTGDQDLSSGDE